MSSSLAEWLTASHWPEITLSRLWRVIRAFPSVQAFFEADSAAWLAAGAKPKDLATFKLRDHRGIESSLAWASEPGQAVLTIDDPRYPALLKAITDPPMVLYVKGDPAVLSQPQIAVVGSRQASVEGAENAFHFAAALVKHGYAVTSGLARGIDAAAHRGALKGKGATIAVMGSGFHHIYPTAHTGLVEDIAASGGAVISEFSVSLPPAPHHFPLRNRVIAALSTGVLVVEAALRSGSLITARQALEQGREVFAIPGSIHHAKARGCHHLIREGATLVETADDIVSQLGSLTEAVQLAMPVGTPLPRLTGRDRVVFDQIGYVTTPLDAIILRSGLTASEVSSILLSLALQGLIQTVAGGVVRATQFT